MDLGTTLALAGFGLFLLAILAFFGWFFCMMNREDEKGEEMQERVYKSSALRKCARYMSARSFFPNSYGSGAWRSWFRK